eukprot:gene3638-3899_t
MLQQQQLTNLELGISSVSVVAGAASNCPSGVNQESVRTNLNLGIGGSTPLFFCLAFSPITAPRVLQDMRATRNITGCGHLQGRGWEQLTWRNGTAVDLNAGVANRTSGSAVHVCLQRVVNNAAAAAAARLANISVIRASATCPEGWSRDSVNLNHASGGNALYLCKLLQQIPTEPPLPIGCGNTKEPMTPTQQLKYNSTVELVEQTMGLTSRQIRAVVQVFVHVIISSNGTGNVSDARIDDNIQLLNDVYNVSANISFQRIGPVLRYQNESWFQSRADCTDSLYLKMKETLWRGDMGVLNVYIKDVKDISKGSNGSRTIAGRSTLPYRFDSGSCDNATYNDGIWLLYSTVTDGSLATQGGMLVHEVGHWLGLLHTFEGGCNGTQANGDEVLDTPAEIDRGSNPRSGSCNITDSCPLDPGNDAVSNWMTYSADICRIGKNDSLTNGQIQRMKNMWVTYRVCTQHNFSHYGKGTTCSAKRFSSELAAICESKRAEVKAEQGFTRVEPCPCGVVVNEDGSLERQWASSRYISQVVTRDRDPFTGETDIDCGGATGCRRCGVHPSRGPEGCRNNADCAAGAVCNDEQECSFCNNKILDYGEEKADCGGPHCSPCSTTTNGTSGMLKYTASGPVATLPYFVAATSDAATGAKTVLVGAFGNEPSLELVGISLLNSSGSWSGPSLFTGLGLTGETQPRVALGASGRIALVSNPSNTPRIGVFALRALPGSNGASEPGLLSWQRVAIVEKAGGWGEFADVGRFIALSPDGRVAAVLADGRVHLFRANSNNAWSRWVVLDPPAGRFFAGDLALGGGLSTRLILAAYTRQTADYAPMVLVYQSTTAVRTWQLVTTLSAPVVGYSEKGTGAYGSFGAPLALSADGSVLVVAHTSGAPTVNDGGVVHVYNFADASGTFALQTSLFSNRSSSFYAYRFGEAVAVSEDGTRILVGAQYCCQGTDLSGFSDSQGAVLYFKKLKNVWSFRRRFVAFDAKEFAYFGSSVAIAGDLGATTAPLDNNYKGSLYMFKLP